MFKNTACLTALLLLFCLQLKAQDNTTVISGVIIDRSSKQAVEFATVQLLNTDSTVVKSSVSDKKGRFSIESIKPGNYIVSCTFIGYEKWAKALAITGNPPKINMGNIQIGVLSANMAEVKVTTTNRALNASIDRKVYNVSQDILANSGSASDILKNIPSVEVDIEGQVSLRGSADVMILINGRPSPLMGKTKAEALKQLPANSIERIEVITNPSARYKPDGTSGIINIVLKKNTKGGINGSILANAGTQDRYNGTVSLNYKPGKLNLFGNYSIRKDRRFRLSDINRTYLDAKQNDSSYYNQSSQSPARPLSHVVTMGMDYSPSEHNSLGISGNYVSRKQVKHDVVNYLFHNKNRTLTNSYDRLRYDPEYEIENDVTAYWQHNFPQEDHQLRVEVNTSGSDEQEDNHYTNMYRLPARRSSMDNTLILQHDHQQQVSVDYTNPLSEDSKLEAGYLGSFAQLDQNFYGEMYDTLQNKFLKDIIKSNRFLYNEYVHAFYATYQHSFKKFSYEAGLRGELANIKANLVTRDSLIKNDYAKVYPTLHLAYKLNNGELQLNYSKRVHRPEGDELNPFPEYQDPRNLRAGNPKLLPEIIHSIEFGYKWQNKNYSFVPSLYYRYRQNGFTSVVVPLNDSTLLTTTQNLSNSQAAGLELIFSAKAGTFFNANLSSNFFYNSIDATSLGFANNKSIISMSTNLNSTFTLSKTTMWQLSFNYRSARLTPQGKVFPTFVFNTGLRQDLFKKKVSVILTASDLFKTLQEKTELNTSFLKQTSIYKRDRQIIYLGVSYRFGKTVKKSGDEKLQFDNNL
jgi:outer membrane receptor protein involved in Fe transport